MKKSGLVLMIMIISWFCYSLDYVPNEIIIKTKKKINTKNNKTNILAIDRKLSAYPISELKALTAKKDNKTAIIRFSEQVDLNRIITELKKDKNIEFVQLNYLNQFYAIPNDPRYTNQRTSMEMMRLPQAWEINSGSNQIVVGIVDSGYLFEHPDLQNNLYTNLQEIPDNGIDDDQNGYIDDVHGWDFADAPNMADIALGDFLGRDNDANDENFHGTHVAGIIGADTNNNTGISGTAWNVKLLPIRAGFRTTQGQGYLEDDDAAAAIIYAADMGCRVVNMSWGDKNYSPIIEDACNYAISKGTILVASAGNDPIPVVSYPAKLENVICVGAVDEYQNLAGFSSYGPDLDIVAPGNQILSTYSLTEEYKEQSGTSMASPFVTGAIALLLSQENNLTLDQVRSKLHSSAKDLGATGFDNQFGAGLIDVFKLLTINNTPQISITSPESRAFVSDEFDIIGSVSALNFWRYSIMFSDKENPSPSEWKDIQTHYNTPVYYSTQVENNVLGHFHFVPLFPDGVYRIRVRVETNDGKSYEKIQIITLDREAPILKQNGWLIQPRWVNNSLKYFIFLAFSEKVQTTVHCKIGDTEYSPVSSMIQDSMFVLPLAEDLPEGNLHIMIKATDPAGFMYQSNWINTGTQLAYDEISQDDFSQTPFSYPLMFARNTKDFNMNGKEELLGMKIDNSVNSTVKAYEYQNGTFVPTFTFSEKFNPLFIGNSNASGNEILALKLDQMELYEALGSFQYPDLPIWSLSDVTGAIYCDFDNNGVEDLAIVRNLPEQTVIEIYKRNQSQTIGFELKHTLLNETQTNSRRMFVPKITAGNLDNDSAQDLVTADTDGDIIIWEMVSGNVPVNTVCFRVPILNCYYLSIMDIDGDFQNELLVGGYVKSTDISQTYWYFEAFKATANNSYHSMGNIFLGNVSIGQSSIATADIDGDNKSEIILALPPNTYVLKYLNNQLKPVWYGSGSKNFQIAAIKKTVLNPGGFFINHTVDDSLQCVFVSPEEPFTGPETPELLKVQVVQNIAELSWKSTNAEHYNIYRRSNAEQEITLIATVSTNSFTDVYNEGEYCEYAVTGVVESMSPQESHFSIWSPAFFGSTAHLLTAQMINKHTLILNFSDQLNSLTVLRGNFVITDSETYPTSALQKNNDQSVLLSFEEAFQDHQSVNLKFINLKTAGNHPIADSLISISWAEDTEAPIVLSLKMYSQNQISIRFSEAMDPVSLSSASNYSLEVPQGVSPLQISSVTVSDSMAILNLAANISNSIYPYHINIQNARDLAGNNLLNNHKRHSLILTEITDLSFMEVYPNPLKLKDFRRVQFVHLPASQSGEIKIFNQAGDLVYQSGINQVSEFSWDAVNQSGKQVGSGLYFYVIRMGKDLKKGKLAIIH